MGYGSNTHVYINGKKIPFEEAVEEYKKVFSDIEDLTPLTEETCRHEFVEYVGLTERYHYCEKCDFKDNGTHPAR